MKEFIESEVLPNKTGSLLILGTFRGFAFPRHMHDGYSIGLVKSGVNRFDCSGTSFEARTNQLCIMNPEQIHSGEADNEGWAYTNLFLKPEALAGALEKEPSASPIWFKQHVLSDPVAVGHFRALTESSVIGMEPLAAECEYTLLLTRLGLLATGMHSEKRAPKTSILRVRDLLDTVCDRIVTLTELAQVADMSTYHLVRSFTEEFDISPYAYHLNRRLLRAQRMIESGILVVDAAFATGFTDQAHFTRHFRRFLGVTPGRVAKFSKVKW